MLLTLLALAGAVASPADHADDRRLIPAFARRYKVSCARCHIAAPKLNSVGEAFRLNGYQFPEADAQPRGEAPLPLGEEPWKDLWPRAVWPGELPATVPFALRIQSDIELVPDGAGGHLLDFRFPQEVYLLAGGSLGNHFGAFLEGGWNREDGLELLQAMIKVQRLVPGSDRPALNLWLGLQNIYLFTFADRQIDRAARQGFLWQRFRPSDLSPRTDPAVERAISAFRLGMTQPAVELNGLLTRRLYYGVGVSQGAGGATTDNNRRKDAYLKLRYKAGGIALDGSVPDSRSVAPGQFGQIYERALVVEGFAYTGSEPTGAGGESAHHAYGVNLRWLHGPADVGVGFVRSREADAWGDGRGTLGTSSLFLKAEYMLYPWLLASLKGERFSFATPRPGAPGKQEFVQQHLMPGLVALIRQNVRLVAEADLFPAYRHPVRSTAPGGVWLRLDVAF